MVHLPVYHRPNKDALSPLDDVEAEERRLQSIREQEEVAKRELEQDKKFRKVLGELDWEGQ